MAKETIIAMKKKRYIGRMHSMLIFTRDSMITLDCTVDL